MNDSREIEALGAWTQLIVLVVLCVSLLGILVYWAVEPLLRNL